LTKKRPEGNGLFLNFTSEIAFCFLHLAKTRFMEKQQIGSSSFSAIILAGGRSTRMGTDKALMQWYCKTLLQHTIDLLTPIFDHLLVSANVLYPLPAGVELVSDERAGCGPAGGIYSCLLRSPSDWNFVISVDSPFVTPEFIGYLKSFLGHANDCVVPVHRNGKEPLVAFYHRRTAEVFRAQLDKGDFKMQNLLLALETTLAPAEDWIKANPRLFLNFNTPEDLRRT